MSVWRRLQRVGKKAAKFQITASLQEVSVECTRQYQPGSLVIVWSRRSRRYSSKPFECTQSLNDEENHYHYVWSMPENVEFVTTLYRNDKATHYEEKEWLCQIEDVGGKTPSTSRGTSANTTAINSLLNVSPNTDPTNDTPSNRRLSAASSSTRRRVLATRQIDMSEFASNLPTQTNLKIIMRLASKKLKSAVLLATLNAVVVKEGDATDEDMISVASLMSLSRVGSFNVGSGLTINDVTGSGPFSPNNRLYASMRNMKHKASTPTFNKAHNFQSDLNELTAKLQALEHGDGRNPSILDNSLNSTSSDVLDSVQKSKNSSHSGAQMSYSSYSTGNNINKSTEPDTKFQTNNDDSLQKFDHHVTDTKSSTMRSSQDLLAWCQEVTKLYWNVRISNLTSSFQNGLAFCAILHHFFPDTIDYDALSCNNSLDNCRLAFDVASKLGIPRVLDPSEVVASSDHPPDLLSMLTYLHQIRTVCCEHEQQKGKALNKLSSSALDGNSDKFMGLDRNGPSTKATVPNTTSTDQNDCEEKLSTMHPHVPSLPSCSPPDHPSPTLNNLNLSDEQIMEPEPVTQNLDKLATNTCNTKKRTSLINYEHMLARARNLLQQSRQNDLAPTTTTRPDALPPLAQPPRGNKTSQPMSTSLPMVSITDDQLNQTLDSSNPQIHHHQYLRHHGRSSNPPPHHYQQHEQHFHHSARMSSRRYKSRRTLYRFNSDGTIYTPPQVAATTGNEFQAFTRSPIGKQSVQTTALSTNVDSPISNSPVVCNSSPDQIEVRRLRLSQMNLFQSGRGGNLTVTTGSVSSSSFSTTTTATVITATTVTDNHTDKMMCKTSGSGKPQPTGKIASYRYALSDSLKRPHLTAQSCLSTNYNGNNSCTNNDPNSICKTSQYILNEQLELDKAQLELDEEAAELEKELRCQMSTNPNSSEADKLLRRWFLLVNRKNTLTRRAVQLSIMENEDDLKKKMYMLQDELRQILSLEDYMKTNADKRRENYLLNDLIQLVNARDDMIQELDIHEKALAQELEIEDSKFLTTNRRQIEKICVIQ